MVDFDVPGLFEMSQVIGKTFENVVDIFHGIVEVNKQNLEKSKGLLELSRPLFAKKAFEFLVVTHQTKRVFEATNGDFF